MSDLEKPKEMLSWSKENGEYKIRLNFSSLDLFNTCMRKAKYSLVDGLRPIGGTSPALQFGTAFHKALEAWYLSPLLQRELPDKTLDVARRILQGEVFPKEQYDNSAYFQAIAAFRDNAGSTRDLPEDDKRAPDNAAKLLSEYFKRYQNDGLTVYCSAEGPLVEKTFTVQNIVVGEGYSVDYFGTIDVILENKASGVIMVADHKTTAALGKEFYNRVKPNHQYTGYVLGAREALGLDTKLFMINGIQVAKTTQDFARQVTERTEEDFQELKDSVRWVSENLIKALERNTWPMSAPNPCTMYGGCQYFDVCHVPSVIKGSVIKARFEDRK